MMQCKTVQLLFPAAQCKKSNLIICCVVTNSNNRMCCYQMWTLTLCYNRFDLKLEMVVIYYNLVTPAHLPHTDQQLYHRA